jgi:hypothetical protein
MSRRYLAYLLWRSGRATEGYRPTYADVSFWLDDGAPPVGEVKVDVVHQHTHSVTRRR